MQLINQTNQRSKGLIPIALTPLSFLSHRFISYFFIVALLFLASCNISSDSVVAQPKETIETDYYTLEVLTPNVGFGYSQTNYGVIASKAGVTAYYEILDATTKKKMSNIRFVRDSISVSPGLTIGQYTFIVRATIVRANEVGEEGMVDDSPPQTLRVGKGAISQLTTNLTLNEPTDKNVKKIVGYTNNFDYGTFSIKDNSGAHVASYEIIPVTSNDNGDYNDIPSNVVITINNEGVITVPAGLPLGKYGFRVKSTANLNHPNYTGEKISDVYSINIIKPKQLGDEPFTIDVRNLTIKANYPRTDYGTISPKEGITATYEILDAETGKPMVGIGFDNNYIPMDSYQYGELSSGKYRFIIKATGTGFYEGEEYSSPPQTLTVLEADINDIRPSEPTDRNIGKIVNYDEFEYGTFSIKAHGAHVASYEIIPVTSSDNGDYNDIPSNVVITIDDEGKITVPAGLPLGKYGFQVKATANKVGYVGVRTEGFYPIIIASGLKKFDDESFKIEVFNHIISDLFLPPTLYGRIYPKEGITATYEIMHADSGTILGGMDVVDNDIIIDRDRFAHKGPKFSRGIYSLRIKAIGTGLYEGQEHSIYPPEGLVVTMSHYSHIISEPSSSKVGKFVGYSEFEYGTFSLKHNPDRFSLYRVLAGKHMGRYEIIPVTSSDNGDYNDIPSNVVITINNEGVITVPAGLPLGKYGFRVKAIPDRIVFLGESITSDIYTIDIVSAYKSLDDEPTPFTIDVRNSTIKANYPRTEYGIISPKEEGITATYEILDAETEKPMVGIGFDNNDIFIDRDQYGALPVGEYRFIIKATGTGIYEGEYSFPPQTLTVLEVDYSFTIDVRNPTIEANYSRTDYGTISPEEGITATYEILDAETGKPMVGIGFDNNDIFIDRDKYGVLNPGEYRFIIKATGAAPYEDEYSSPPQTLTVLEADINDITPSEPTDRNIEKALNYGEFESVFSIKAHGVHVASYEIIPVISSQDASYDNIPSEIVITIDDEGKITVPAGLPLGKYGFQVKAIANKVGYIGVRTEGFYTITIVAPKQLGDEPFTIDVRNPTIKVSYPRTDYGIISPKEGITATYEILDAETGKPMVGIGFDNNYIPIDRDQYGALSLGEYRFIIKATGTGPYEGSEYSSPPQTLTVLEVDYSFTIDVRNSTIKANYPRTDYGIISPEKGITATYEILDAETGKPMVGIGFDNNYIPIDRDQYGVLTPGVYRFIIKATGAAPYEGEYSSPPQTLTVTP